MFKIDIIAFSVLDDYYHACGNYPNTATATSWNAVTCTETVLARYVVIQVKYAPVLYQNNPFHIHKRHKEISTNQSI